jgi:hypothetical protein
MKKNLLILTMVMAGGCIGLHAQEYATDKSIRDQILNNKQPGAVYAPSVDTKQTPAKGFEGSSLKKQIVEGKLGTPVKTGTGSTNQATETKRPAGLVLPSEATVEQRQAELDKQKTEDSNKAVTLPASQGTKEPGNENQVKPVEQKVTPETKAKTD